MASDLSDPALSPPSSWLPIDYQGGLGTQTHKHRYRPTNTDTQALTDPQTQVHKQTGCKQLKNTGEPKPTKNVAAAAFIAVENTDEHKTNAEKKCKPRRKHHTT